MSGEPVKKCLRCGRLDSTLSESQYIAMVETFGSTENVSGVNSYSPARRYLCHICWKWEIGPEYADIWLIFHEIAEAYPETQGERP